MSPELYIPHEIPKQDDDTTGKSQKTFDPIEQRVAGSIDLINKEYQEKTGQNLSNETKQLLIHALKGKNQDERDEILDIVSSTIQEGLNIEDELKNYLGEIVGEKIKKDTNDLKTETKIELANYKNNFTQLANSLESLSGEGKNYKSILSRIKNLQVFAQNGKYTKDFDQAVKSILSDLKNSPNTLQTIALDLQAQDAKNGTHHLDIFRHSLISLDPSFKNILSAAEAKAKLALGNNTLKGATINRNISQTSPDGFTTTAKLDGTGRTIGRIDSKYRLKSTLKFDEQVQREADRITTEANKELEPINITLQNLHAVKIFLESAVNQNIDIEEVKEIIKKFSLDIYITLGLDNIVTFADIKIRVNNHIETVTIHQDKIEREFQESLNKLTSYHFKELADKQKYQKQILEILHNTGIDSLEQGTLDLIFKNINLNYAKFGFTTKISFENGSLGFDTDSGNKEINPQEKKRFYEACNRIITGTPYYPIGYENGNLIYYATKEDAQNSIPANHLFEIQRFVKASLGISPEITGKRNLENSISQYGLIGTKND